MNKLRVIIVEDEPLAIELLEDYIASTSVLLLLGKFTTGILALDFLKENEVDVIFLDIHLPKIKGLSLINLLPKTAQIIITTAYHQYAVQSYEYEVIDYLLKPIEFDRFIKAINKLEYPKVSNSTKELLKPDYLFLNVNKRKLKIFYKNILFIESNKGYIRIHLDNDEQVMTKVNISKIEKILPNNFLRIHKSFIFPLDKLLSFSARKIEIKGHQLPIGRVYQKQILKQLNQLP